MRLYALCAMSLAACAFEPTGPGDPGDPGLPDPGVPSDVDAGFVEHPPDPTPPPAPAPTVICRVENEHLGMVGLEVIAGSRTYTFASWALSATGAPTGFTLTGPSTVRYEVRVDDDRHTGDSLVYTGSELITRVDFCVSFDDDD